MRGQTGLSNCHPAWSTITARERNVRMLNTTSEELSEEPSSNYLINAGVTMGHCGIRTSLALASSPEI